MKKLIGIGFVALLCSCQDKVEYATAGRWQIDAYPPNSDGVQAKGGYAFSTVTYKNLPITIERKLIKNASIDFEVKDLEATSKSITQMTTETGGYISSETQEYNRHEQVIRIPAEKLDEFLIKLEGLASHVTSKNTSSNDVTEEFIDTETRLKTKKALEVRYLDLLKQAKTVKDLIEVETQLANVRSEIESMEGRLKYLGNQVALSTVTASYYQATTGNNGFAYRFSKTFGNGWDNFLEFIIGIFEAWPFLIIGGVLIWLFIRWRRRKIAQ